MSPITARRVGSAPNAPTSSAASVSPGSIADDRAARAAAATIDGSSG
ncbi:hypothetical protein ACRAWC_02220 [Leifsonia sp. L25]